MALFDKLNAVEPMRAWEDHDVQLEYWNAKLCHEVKVKYLLGVAPDPEVIRTILALPDEARAKREVLELAEKLLHKKQLQDNKGNRAVR